MPFRAKMKKAFGSKRSGSNSPDDAGTPKIPGIEYYKPNEIPKPKFRGRVDPAHAAKLHAFSFSDAFGRRTSSIWSSYSPSGTKAQSRRASTFSKKSKSDADDEKSLRRKSTNPPLVQENAEEEGEVANGEKATARSGEHIPLTAWLLGLVADLTMAVILSRNRTADKESVELTHGENSNDLRLEQKEAVVEITPAQDLPFTTQELERAMAASSLKSRA